MNAADRRTGIATLTLAAIVAVGVLRFHGTANRDRGDAASRVERANRRLWFRDGRPALPVARPESAEGWTRAIRGLVTDAVTGAPLIAEVRILKGASVRDAVWTDDTGRFEFPPEVIDVDGIAAKSDGYAVDVHSLPGAQEDVLLALDSAVHLSGRVIDAHGPVVGMNVIARDSAGARLPYPQSELVLTGDDGAFDIRDAPSGILELKVWAETRFQKIVEVGALGPGREKTGIEITLPASPTRVVGVVSVEGTPVAGAVVDVYGEKTGMGRSIETDAVGHYCADIGPKGHYVISVSSLDAGIGVGEVELPEVGEVRADIALQSIASLDGTLKDESGAAIEGADISADRAGGTPLPLPPALSKFDGEMLEKWSTRRHVVSGADGKFHIRSLNVSSVEISVKKSGKIPIRRRIAIPAADLELVMERGAIVTGAVIGRDGKPWTGSGGFVRANSSSDAPSASAGETTVRSGAFALEGLEDGDYSVSFRDDLLGESDHVHVDVRRGAPARIELRLTTPGIVTGRIVSSGAPVAGARVGPGSELPPYSYANRVLEGAVIDLDRAARSRPDGRFSLLIENRATTLVVYHPEYSSALRFVPPVESGRTIDLGDIEVHGGTGSPRVPTRCTLGLVLALEGASACKRVSLVWNGGGAEDAGIKVGDCVLAVDGVPVGPDFESATSGAPETVAHVEVSSEGKAARMVDVTRCALGPAGSGTRSYDLSVPAPFPPEN